MNERVTNTICNEKVLPLKSLPVCQDDHSMAIIFSMLLTNLKNQTLWLPNFIMISEEQWENDKISFQMSEDI